MKVILDVTGGRDAPGAALEAAAALSLDRPLELTLVGDQHQITEGLSRLAHDPARLIVHHSPSGELSVAMGLLAADPGAALVTASDPARLLEAASAHLNLLPGVDKPALCAVYPTARRRGKAKDPFVLLLDVGAAFEASAEELVGYARMGSAYAAQISRNPKPAVALLAVQRGQRLGPPEVARAAAMLEADPNLHFIGPVSGVDIPRGSADVIICQGYVGQTVIGLLEGVGEVAVSLARSLQEHSIRGRLALQAISGDIQSFSSLTDWKEYGGAPLLGYDRPIIVADADAPAESLSRAVRLAVKTIRTDIIGAIRELTR